MLSFLKSIGNKDNLNLESILPSFNQFFIPYSLIKIQKGPKIKSYLY
jgi:hypothetical protein